MKNFSKYFFAWAVVVTLWSAATTVRASTPTLSLTANSDGNTVQVTVNGDSNASVLLFYNNTNTGSQVSSLGMTSSNGTLNTTVDSHAYGIASSSPVYVRTGGLSGPQSATVNWPNIGTSGTFSLNPTGAVLAVGQTATLQAVNYGSSSLYVSNNSNPPVANVNISGGQITVNAIGNGSSVVTICTTGSPSSCASAYVTVSSSGAQSLSFSMSNVTVTPGQNVPIVISGGSGSYSIINNSNSSIIQTSLSGSTLTLSTQATSGSAAITLCSTDMTACGIVNATAGSASTLPLSFTPNNPTVSTGQSAVVSISGGSVTTYYVSNNSNTAAVSTAISGSNLTLTGLTNGTATITVCSTSGSCGAFTATVSYVSQGGALSLSQTTAVLLVGQVVPITISGGTSPYTVTPSSGSTIFQASLNGNILTLSGMSAGSGTLNICSAGGACVTLNVTVNASGAGTPLTLSQSSVSLPAGGATAVTMTGSGGYYVSTNANSSVAAVTITGSTAVVTGLTAGSTNVSVCQSGGQCTVLFVTVTNSSSAAALPTFSQNNPTLAINQILTETITGGASGNYYIMTNTNPAVAQLSLNNNQLKITGLGSGASTIVICAASNSCGVLTATVSGTLAPSSPLSLPATDFSGSPSQTKQSFNYQLQAVGGTSPYTYTINSGNLPTGLILSSAGLITGTPTAAGTYNFVVKVTDSAGVTASTSFTLIVHVPVDVPVTPVVVPPTPSSAPGNGQLILENGTIYMVYRGTKVGFTNADAFLGLGFKFSDVTTVSNSGLSIAPRIVFTADGAHPRGTWVIAGQTVYFVTPDGLIPVPTWDIFLNNGGQAGYIVKANSYDLAMHKLAPMATNDSRLK